MTFAKLLALICAILAIGGFSLVGVCGLVMTTAADGYPLETVLMAVVGIVGGIACIIAAGAIIRSIRSGDS